MGDGHRQGPVILGDAPRAQQGRGTVEHGDLGVVGEPEPEPTGIDLDPVADLELSQHRGREIDHHVVDPAVLARDQAPLPGAGAADHARPIADTGVGDEGVVRAAARTHHLATIVVQRDAGLDVVAGETHAAVADALIDRDPAGRGQDARHAVVADPVGIGAPDRMGDLPRDGHDHQIAVVDAHRLAAPAGRTEPCGCGRLGHSGYQKACASSQGSVSASSSGPI